jgi:hypothetical protein
MNASYNWLKNSNLHINHTAVDDYIQPTSDQSVKNKQTPQGDCPGCKILLIYALLFGSLIVCTTFPHSKRISTAAILRLLSSIKHVALKKGNQLMHGENTIRVP